MDNKVVGVLYKSDPHYHVMKHGPREWIAEPMVRCTDGQVRRFPPSGDRSSNYASQVRLGLIYDIPADRVTHRIGGIEISPDHSEVAFLSGGNPVRPIKVGQFDAYQLPGGRFMIPQPTFRDCTYACELMMALDQGSVSIDTARGYPMPRLDFRREMSDIMASLQEQTGRTPILVEHNMSYKKGMFGGIHDSRKAAWRDLGNKIDQMGPCILSKRGHVVMLDGVREEKGRFFLTIREPFHGTSLEFKDSAEFFRDTGGLRQDVSIEAIFLPQGKDSSVNETEPGMDGSSEVAQQQQ